MNIVTKCTLLLTATLITGLSSFQSHASVFGGSGQYVMMPLDKGNSIWVMDTETGKIRWCFNLGSLEKPPKCGPWSEE